MPAQITRWTFHPDGPSLILAPDSLEAAQRAGARLRTGAIVDKLAADARSRISAVSCLDPGGTRTTLSATTYVIAAHGFETPKLLLVNELANGSGMVGRNLMIHPTLSMGLFADEPLWVGRGQYLHGANLQHRLRDDRGTVSGGFYQFMNNHAGPAMTDALFKQGGMLGEGLDEELRRRASRFLSIQLLLEDLPQPDNAITLNPSFRDTLGLPGIRMRYRLQDYAKAALSRTMDDYANWLQAMNAVPQEASRRHLVQSAPLEVVVAGTRAPTVFGVQAAGRADLGTAW